MFVNHVHLMPAEVREDASIDALMRLADNVGIEGAVCFAPFDWVVRRTDIEDHNQWLADTIKPYPNLIGCGTFVSSKPAREQVEQFVDLGFKGVKMHPAVQKFALYDDWAQEAYAALAEHGLVATFHTGIHGHKIEDTCDPVLFDKIAQTFPELRMVFAHVGGWHFFREMVAVIVNSRRHGPHLYAGITSVLDRENQRYWYLGKEGIEDCRWQIGPDLLVYGLDFPYNQQPQIERDLEVIRSLDWPQEDIDGILGNNLKRLLGLIEGEVRKVGGDPNPAKKK